MKKAPSTGERQLASFCRPRGIQPATAQKADLRFLSGADHCQIMGRTSVNYPAIGIRYFDLAGQPTSHIRTRALTDSDANGKSVPKYLQKKETPNRLYFPPVLEWTTVAADPNTPIVIAEGELKALVACQLGLSTIAVSGVYGWKKRSDDGDEKTSVPIPDLTLIDWKGRTVFICYDSDAATNPDVRRAEIALAKELFGRGAVPRIVRLPTLPGETKTGLDDFIVTLKGKWKKAWAELTASAEYPCTIREMSATDIMNAKFKEATFIVKRLVPVGLTTFSGDPKNGKSWAAISIACAVASNTQVFDGFEVATPGSVLYLALEDTAPRIQKRLKALGLPAPPKLSFAFARDVRQGDDGCAMVEHWCREHADAKLIIIDTLQRFRTPTSGRQNAYEADYAAIGAIKQIADKYTVGIMLIHHLRKGGSDDAFARVSGSTAITGAADANIVLLRDRGTGEAIWHITGRDIEDMEVAMKFDGGQWTVLGDAAHHRASQAEQAVIAALQAIGEPATPKEIGEYLGRKIGSRQLLRMREAGLVEWQPGGKYHVTNKAATDKPRKF
jgi:AAA domain/Domain of unknown function (DUF3854)